MRQADYLYQKIHAPQTQISPCKPTMSALDMTQEQRQYLVVQTLPLAPQSQTQQDMFSCFLENEDLLVK